MNIIKKNINKEKNLTIFKVFGEFPVDEIIGSIKEFYFSEFTLNVIYDLTHADVSSTTTDEIKDIITFAKKYANFREGGKTALVMSSNLGYGLARMYAAYSELENDSISHYVCKNIYEAMSWLDE